MLRKPPVYKSLSTEDFEDILFFLTEWGRFQKTAEVEYKNRPSIPNRQLPLFEEEEALTFKMQYNLNPQK